MYDDSKEFDDLRKKKHLLTWLLISHFLSFTLSVKFIVWFSVCGTSYTKVTGHFISHLLQYAQRNKALLVSGSLV